MSEDYEKLISLARITEQAERHEETIKYMEKIIEQKKEDLTIEERNILSSAYKSCVSSRRNAWRSIYSVEVKERTNGSKFLKRRRKGERRMSPARRKKTFNKGTFKNVMLVQVGTDISGAD